MRYLKASWIAAKHSFRLGATFGEGMELAALCVLAVARAESPCLRLTIGQARALARRIEARNAARLQGVA